VTPPKLLSKERRYLGLLLALVAIAQAAFAAAFADAISAMVGQTNVNATAAIILATAFGVAMLAERWIAERFAQSFVLECRVEIFESVIRNRGEGQEARWLTSLVGDLTAIRNYAVRGSVKLWTSMLAGVVASAWFISSSPAMAVALLPLLVGFVLVIGTTLLLRRVIAEQRNARGRLNRFVIRRVRIEMAGAPAPRGHGRLRLAELSGGLRSKVERRAFIFGTMELLAGVAGGIASVILIVNQVELNATAVLVGQISLIGFISTRLLETARALHARAGGRVALDRLANLLARDPSTARGHSKSNDIDSE
jgi:ABC-type multidrug transport system fused ATPase/permease subunit